MAAVLFVACTVSLHAATLQDEIRAVEHIRGLRFTQPIHEVSIDRSELPKRLREQFVKTLPYSLQDWTTVLRALRLVPQGSDEQIVSSLLDLYQQQVLAYYDPPTRTYYTVRQMPASLKDLGETDMLEASVAVHELTHALQDQHFDIGKKDEQLRDDADANYAYHALIEGEASLVMTAYLIDRAGGSFDEVVKSDLLVGTLSAAASQQAMFGDSAPPYFVAMMKFPYVDGLRFVIEAYRRGGWGELDRIYADPPRSTREILNPEEYFGKGVATAPFVRTPPISVPHLLSVEHLGEFHWAFLAGAANARGWMGDRVTIAQDAFCAPTVLAETQWQTEEDARRFYDAYTRALDDAGVGSLSRIRGTSVDVAYGADRALMERFITR